MKKVSLKLVLPVMIGIALVLPFILLELINRQNLPGVFPTVLFVAMWLLSAVIIFLIINLIKNHRSLSTAHIITRLVLLLVAGYVWFALIIDQMPCFLGVVNCD